MHKHEWGPWHHPNEDRIDWYMGGVYRLCGNGMCDHAQYRNGRIIKRKSPRVKVLVPRLNVSRY